MADKIKVVLVDDHEIVRKGICKALAAEPDVEIVGETGHGRRAISMANSLRPDVLVLDIGMPEMGGVAVAREIRERGLPVNIVAFSIMTDRSVVAELFKVGISGYVLKDAPIAELALAVRAAAKGGVFYSRPIQQILQTHMVHQEVGEETARQLAETEDGIARLTLREKEIFLLLADGLKPGDIGRRLGISAKTAETHKYNILDKLGLENTAQLTKLAFKKDLLDM